MIRVDVEEAQNRLEELVEAAMRGEEVIIEEGGFPQVSLVPVSSADADSSLDQAGP
jgi:prevent-host-death family protein